MKTQIIEISKVKIDDKLYPRTHIDWITCARYYNAMKSGAVFPPIVVAQLGKEYFLIDGAHRLKAYKDMKETHINAEVVRGLNKQQIYLEAVKANISHGRQFSTQEVTKICITLKDWNMSQEQIQEIVRIPANELAPFVAKRMTRITETREEIPLKAPLRNLSEFNGNMGIDEEPNQRDVYGSSQLSLMDSLIALLKNGWMNLSSELVRNKLIRIRTLIDEILLEETDKNVVEIIKPKITKVSNAK